MSYKSIAEREREQWITRREAIALIAKLDGCDRRSASKQLHKLLGDRQLRIKFGGPKPKVIGVAAPDAIDWRQARFRRNKVLDQWTGPRLLLIFKNDILRQWEKSSVASAGSESGQGIGHSSKIDPSTKAEVGAHSAQDEIEETYHRLVQQDSSIKTKSPTEVARLIAKACGKKLGEKRGWSLRRLLEYIQLIREVERTYPQFEQQDPSVKTMAPTEVAKLIAKACGIKLGPEHGWVKRMLLQQIQRIRGGAPN